MTSLQWKHQLKHANKSLQIHQCSRRAGRCSEYNRGVRADKGRQILYLLGVYATWCSSCKRRTSTVEVPVNPLHHKKTPAKIHTGPSENECATSVKENFRRIYIEATDHIIESIKSRLYQPSFTTCIYKRLQNVVLNACNQCSIDEDECNPLMAMTHFNERVQIRTRTIEA